MAIGRSLIYRPAIVLADEPTGNLDRNNSNEIIELLKSSNKKYKQTIILVTHDEKWHWKQIGLLRWKMEI